MELTFLRGTSRLLNGTFDTPAVFDDNNLEVVPAKPTYRVFTAYRFKFQPVRTTITFIGSENSDEHREVAQILWNCSRSRSYVYTKGRIYMFNEFMRAEPGIFNTTSVLNLGGEEFFWRTHDFEPQCYDTRDNQVVKYERKMFKTHPRRQAHLTISEEIAGHPDKLDAILLSFWIFKICRDVHIPWKRKYVPKPLGAGPAKKMPAKEDPTIVDTDKSKCECGKAGSESVSMTAETSHPEPEGESEKTTNPEEEVA